jgi:hypothetical protein
MSATVTWADAVAAIGGIATPIAVLSFGFLLNKRIKRIEALEWRNQELTRTRLAFYREIAEPINDLLCYFTFIGGWKELTPPDVIQLKRRLDKTFYVAAPLFSEESAAAYGSFMAACFSTFGAWGQDARLRTGFRRRREHLADQWRTEWDELFEYQENRPIHEEELRHIAHLYSCVLSSLVADIKLLEPRHAYTDAPVVMNAG